MISPALRSLLTVISEGSLNRAALRLGISQPALSRQMQALEQEVGGPLLERGSAGVKPTAAGLALATQVKPLIAMADAALAEARRLARGQHERLRIGYLMSAAQSTLAPALVDLRRQFPKLKTELLDLSPGEQIEALRRGEIDMALVGQEGKVLGRDFYTRSLAKLPVLAALPADHPLAAKGALPLNSLRGELFISSPEEHMPGRDRWITSLCRRAGFRPRFGTAADSVSHLLALVASEPGVTLLPATARCPVPGVAFVPLSDSQVTWDLLVMWHRGKTSEPLKVLLNALAEHSRQQI